MRIAPLLALLLAAACAPVPIPPTPETPASEFAPRNADERAEAAACPGRGGRLDRVGKLQALRCIETYADAGKACTDGAQCLGKRCVGDFEDASATTPATGTCVATNNPFGCQTIIQSGVARTICVD